MIGRPKLKYTCREGVALLQEYLRALEANYCAHLPYIEALETDKEAPAESLLAAIDQARERLREARSNLIEHQETHGCTLPQEERFHGSFAA